MGIDIGSINAKLIILDEARIIYQQASVISEKSEIEAERAIQKALISTSLTREEIDFVVATGHSGEQAPFADMQKSSFMCLFKGGIECFQGPRTIVDVGAENTTVVALDDKGWIKDFIGNDKCAAGGGVFLVSMAKTLGLSLEELAQEGMRAEKGVDITSTCTIFAEQEALSYAFEDPPPSRPEIAAGLHESLASRVVGLVARVGAVSPVLLCGGVALNTAFVRSFKRLIKAEVCLPEAPQFVPAIGAAFFGRDEVLNQKR